VGEDDGKGDGELGEGEKTEDAGGPGEADGGQQAHEGNGVEDAADGGTGGGEADGQGAPLSEGHSDEGDAWGVEDAGADTDAPALGQHDLPVSGAEREHHDTKDREKGADVEQRADVPAIVDGPRDHAAHDQEDALDSPYPGNGVCRDIWEGALVVRLVGAVGAEQAPRRGIDEEGAEGLHPGAEALAWVLSIQLLRHSGVRGRW